MQARWIMQKSVFPIWGFWVCTLRVLQYYIGRMYTYLTENIILKFIKGNWCESGMQNMKASWRLFSAYHGVNTLLVETRIDVIKIYKLYWIFSYQKEHNWVKNDCLWIFIIIAPLLFLKTLIQNSDVEFKSMS